jgi:DNA end-binding protein Ku
MVSGPGTESQKTALIHRVALQLDRGFMAQRPIWEGHLRLSLVACPVALFNATTSTRDISFHLLHKDTHNRIRMIPHDPDLGEVERKDLVKGYEIEKDQYVVVTDDEIKSVRLPSTRTIDIERFVDAAEIDRIYWNAPYYLTPNSAAGIDAYTVVRDAMGESGKIALGKVVLHMRERMVALEARDKGILCTTLRTKDEVRDQGDFFSSIPNVKADKKMIEIAEKIIAQQEAEFDPAQFRDRYEDALRKLIEAKTKGHRTVEAPPPEKDNVIDLMEALKKSLKGADKSSAPRSTAGRAAHAPRRQTSRSPAKSSRRYAGRR